MAQNFRVNESRNTLWIGIALVTAAAVVILALAAQDFPGTGGRSNQAEGSIATTGTASPLGTDSSEYLSIPGTAAQTAVADELNPPFLSSAPWSPAPSRALVPEAQVEAGQFMPHPPFEAAAVASIPERATDPVVWMPHPPYTATPEVGAATAGEIPTVTNQATNNSLPGLSGAPVAEIPTMSYEATLVAEHAWLAELRNASTAGSEGVTYLDRIVPDDSLVPVLGRAPAAEVEKASMADFRLAEAASNAEFGIVSAAGIQGGTYWDHIVPDNTLVPNLGRAPAGEQYFEMAWRTPVSLGSAPAGEQYSEMPWRTPVTDTRAHQPQ